MSILSDFLGRMTCQANGPGRCRAGLVGLLEGNLAAAFAQQVKPRPPPMQHLQLDTEGGEAAADAELFSFTCAAAVDTRAVRMISWGRQS